MSVEVVSIIIRNADWECAAYIRIIGEKWFQMEKYMIQVDVIFLPLFELISNK